MHIKDHVISAVIISIILYPFVKLNVLYFIIGAVLIDADHYLYYAIRYRKFNLIKIHNLWIRHPKKFAEESMCIFHTGEFISLIVILSFFSFEGLMFTLGVLFHMALDVYYQCSVLKFPRNYSLFRYINRSS